MSEPIGTVAVVGAGQGGRAVAADLALQGIGVRLFEWPEYAANITALQREPVILATGEVEGAAPLERVTTDLQEATAGADLVVACVQGPAHERLAHELGPLVANGATIVLNPGSTGGALEFRRVFREAEVRPDVVLAETGTLTHCSRTTSAGGVHIALRVRHVAFACLPAAATAAWLGALKPLFPGLKPRADVLEVALCNGNPVIHPAIMLGSAATIERLGEAHRFYADGVTPAVARVIEAVDRERRALGRALGYHLLPEPEMCVAQGYATSPDYRECYATSPVFAPLASPPSLDHRYLHEDVGLGLVTYVSLGEWLGVPTPVSRGLVALASEVVGRDYLGEGRRTAERLGLTGKTAAERRRWLQEG